MFQKKLFKKYYKFAFVRNPWDRLVSTFCYLRAGGKNRSDKAWAEENLSKYNDFNDFVKKWVNSTNIYKYIHFIPQHKFICINGKIEVDFLGYFENFENDFIFIRDKLGIIAELSHLNKSKRGNYKSYYNEETKKIVAKVYKKDIEIFSYDFEGKK